MDNREYLKPERRRRRRRIQPPDLRKPLATFGVLAALSLLICVVGYFFGSQPDQPIPPETTPAATSAPTQPSTEPTETAPAIDQDSWNLLLVNPWNTLPSDYTIETATLSNGLEVDERCYADLQAMLKACRAEGLSPVVCSAYRSRQGQEDLFQEKVNSFLSQGYSQTRAEQEAEKVVAVPGTSEHQLGLAVDIVDESYQLLDEAQEKTAVQKWLLEHCWEYGFILRYPNDKREETGIIYEPWHYRYVGKEHAAEIHKQGVCLEEYLKGA